MRWKKARRSENVEDRRGSSTPKKAALTLGGGSIIVVLLGMLFGVDLSKLGINLGGTGALGAGTEARSTTPLTEADKVAGDFVRSVLGSTEDTWNRLFREQRSEQYKEPKLVLFRDAVESACGFQQAAVGPFYCPADQQVYIDLSFYETLEKRLGAGGDFAQAYVIAHEVGHHVQNLLGASRKVHAQQGRVSKAEFNDLSVRLELQADFYAGVWAHFASRAGLLEAGDIEEALTAAAAIGDDTLQRRSGQTVRPESFTHGTSEQRVRWFRRGLETGDMRRGDTFAARDL